MTDQLKPCPFCGGKVIDDYSGVIEYCGRGHKNESVECRACDYELTIIEDYDPDDPKFNTFQELCNRWNTRHIPEGYQLVPVESTKAMRKAGREAKLADGKYQGHEVNDIYNAMIKAAGDQDD